MKKELLKGLTEEQIKKVSACKNTDELLALAKEEGLSLTDEQLEAVNGGGCLSTNAPDVSKTCKKCGRLVEGRYIGRKSYYGLIYEFACECGYTWKGSKNEDL